MRRKIAIIGGGASALILGCELDSSRFEVSIYERNAAPGRKFLVAGEGGLNLTHSEIPASFIQRYTPPVFLQEHFQTFSNTDFIAWLNRQGIETMIGSSGRVFPKKGMKPVEVLNMLLKKIKDNGVQLHTKYTWKGFTKENNLLLEHHETTETVSSDVVIFCLGGASWPVTGSKGEWANYFSSKGIVLRPFEASNCSFAIHWPAELLPAIEGKALKNCVIRCGDGSHAGEVVLTRAGLEGSGIYPLSPEIRKQLRHSGKALITIDLKPTLSTEALLKKLEKGPGRQTYSRFVAGQLNLNSLQMALLKYSLTKEAFMNTGSLVAGIKNLNLEISGTGPVDDAISTVGGIALQEIDNRFELKKLPGHFAIGEMLDFDAPTGGYLLQAAFTMGYCLSKYLNNSKL